MTPTLRNGLLVTAACAALAAGYTTFDKVFRAPAKEAEAAPLDFSLPDVQGKTRWLSEWQGHPVVLNFWATWCAPCREEIPLFQALEKDRERNGVRIVGVAIDNRAAVAEYAKTMHIGYPLLLAEEAGLSLMSRYGNPHGSLPFTVIIGRDGVVVSRKLGAYKEPELRAVLESLANRDSATILSK